MHHGWVATPGGSAAVSGFAARSQCLGTVTVPVKPILGVRRMSNCLTADNCGLNLPSRLADAASLPSSATGGTDEASHQLRTCVTELRGKRLQAAYHMSLIECEAGRGTGRPSILDECRAAAPPDRRLPSNRRKKHPEEQGLTRTNFPRCCSM